MIEHEQKVNGEAIGDINTNLREAIESDSSSSEDESMPDLQERAREDSSSDRDTNSFGENGIYDNGEQWGPKELSLRQIIDKKSGGMFSNNVPTLYAFSWHGYAQIYKDPPAQTKSDFYQAKE